MTTPSHPTPLTRLARPVRRRGSAIILIVVSIVLLAILGATFVQVTRFERIEPGAEHLNIALDSILNEVGIVLAQDLHDNNSNFFNPAGSPSDLAHPGGGDEPYDYPWRNRSSNYDVTFVDSTSPVPTLGGVYDDTWLAPGTLNAANQWSQVSDLLGRFLDYTDANLTVGVAAGTNPSEVVVNIGNIDSLFETLDITDPRLVDADGDGMGDSLWAYAPTAEVAGKRYVFAIRIVDLSARVNVNTAVGPNASVLGTEAQGDSPTEIDGSQFINNFGGAPEFDNTVIRRLSPGAWPAWGDQAPMPGVIVQRRHYWLNGASVVDLDLTNRANAIDHPDYSPGNTYGMSDLFELLYKNGLNNMSLTTAIEDPGTSFGMPVTLRTQMTALDETSADGVVTGASNATTNPAHAGIYLRDNPRLHLTTASGVMAIAPSAGTLETLHTLDSDLDSINERVLQADINHGDIQDIFRVIRETLMAGSNFDATQFTHFAPSGTFDVNQFASQLAANIVDLRDSENQLTEFTPLIPPPLGSPPGTPPTPGAVVYGMEALPFIAEVYVQRRYNTNTSVEDLPVGSGVYDHTFSGGDLADYVIEIRNPFNRPILLENVYLYVDGAPFGGISGELSTFPGVPTSHLLEPGAVMLIHRNETEDVTGGYAFAPNDINAPISEDWPIGQAPVDVELRAENQGGSVLAWPYCELTVDPLETDTGIYEVDNLSAIAPLAEARLSPTGYFIQHSYHGTSGLNLIQCQPNDFGGSTDTPDTHSTLLEIGSPLKLRRPSVSGGQFAGDFNTGDQQWLFLDKTTTIASTTTVTIVDDDGRIPYVADILTIPVIGPNNPNAANTTLGEAFADAATARLDGLMLDYTRHPTSATHINNSFDTLNVPHAILLLERLTTHSPAFDGFDVNRDTRGTVAGTLDDLEVFVPGKINLNTASFEVLREALPFPTQAQRDAVARRIIAYRNNMTGLTPLPSLITARPPTNSRAAMGIAYIGELYEPLTADLGAQAGPDWNDRQIDPSTFEVTTSAPYSSTSDGIGISDGFLADREEDLMLAKWLNEMCSTRSDVFAVYVVVEGYPANNFGAGAVERARVVAVFSRANVRQAGDTAQLIAVRRVE